MRQARRARPPGGEFRFLWLAEGLSVLGDQLAKVAVALLVFSITGSAALSGLSYGVTFLPALVAGPLLSGLADRYPRRTVMVCCNLGQAATVGAMALPDVPVLLLIAGAVLIAAIQAPFKAAQGAVVLDILGPGQNKAGRARLTVVRETGQLAGLAGGAVVVAFIGTGPALALDALTFLLAAALVGAGLRPRPAARSGPGGPVGAGPLAVWRLLRTDRVASTLAFAITLIGLTAAPDAVIVPLIEEAGAPDWVIGPLLAADCVGLIGAGWYLARQPPQWQRRLIGPLAVLSMAPLALFVLRPEPVLLGLLLVVSGVGSAYLPLAIGEFTERVHGEIAGTANGLLNAALRASQGLAAITVGVIAEVFSAAMAVAVIGMCGVILASVCAVRWTSGTRRPVTDSARDSGLRFRGRRASLNTSREDADS